VVFHLTFCSPHSKSSSAASGQTETSGRLELEISGAGSDGLHVSVKLSVEMESPEAPNLLLGTQTMELLDTGTATCMFSWPESTASATIVCFAELVVVKWEASTFCYETTWLQGNSQVMHPAGPALCT